MSDSDYLHRVRQAHRDLGIPQNYAQLSELPLYFEPQELVATGPDFLGRPQRLTPTACEAWRRLRQAAAEDGIELFLVSAFRSLDYQCELIKRKLARGQSIEAILEVNAAPGYSEHHTGRAVDIGTPECDVLLEQFENTNAFQWLVVHSSVFGFKLSFPRDNVHGIAYEPWHWCHYDLDSAGLDKAVTKR